MTAVIRLNKVKEFQKTDMRSRKDYLTIIAPAVPQCSILSVSSMESGVTKVSNLILATLFKKANELLRHKDLIVKKPGTDDESYTVAGHTNQICCATPGKEGSFKCDWNCVYASTQNMRAHYSCCKKIWYIIPDFITWYKRFKSGPSVTKMVLGVAPKTAGRNLVLEKDRIVRDHLRIRLWIFWKIVITILSKGRIKMMSRQCKYLSYR